MTDTVVWPAYAYAPGKAPRHPEGAFDQIRDTATSDMSLSQLAECQAFRIGLRYLDAGFHWEAHEVLEPVWMALPAESDERRFVQGLIQLANGLLKLRMARPKAALRLAHMARDLTPCARAGAVMGVELAEFHRWIDSLEQSAKDEL